MLNKEQGTLTINLPNLIRTLGEYLYSDPNVALREILQNAHDTCVVAHTELPRDFRPEIHVRADPFDRILEVTDNGAGLTEAEVKKFLTVIGNSRTDEVRKHLEELGRTEIADRLIGRFGIGLLSAFIVAQRVEFQTRSRKSSSQVIQWECDGGSEYQISKLPDSAAPLGTTVRLYVDPRYIGLLSSKELTRLIRRYADLLRVPIFLDPNPIPLNAMEAPWDRCANLVEYHDYLRQRYPNDNILDVIPINIDEDNGATKVKGALFVPKQQHFIVREHGDVTIYCHRYFVCDDNRTLLPPWARFVRGVVDTPSLREMASREAVLHDDNFDRVQTALGSAILTFLNERHDHHPDLFAEIVNSHEVVIKAWAVANDDLFDHIKDIVLFDTDVGKLTLPEYFHRSKVGVKGTDEPRRIFYFSTPGGPGQHAVLFNAKGIRVIDASEFPNLSLLEKYAKRMESIELHRLDLDARGFIFESIPHKDRKWRELESIYSDLHVDAEVVLFVPDEIPGVLLNELFEEAELPELQNLVSDPAISSTIKALLQQALNRAEERERNKEKRTLYLNARNTIIQNLTEMDFRDEETVEVVKAIYHNALLLSLQGAKLALTPKDAKAIFDGTNRTLATLIKKTFELRRSQSELLARQAEAAVDVPEVEPRERNPLHTVCFFAVPFDKEFDTIHHALKEVLEDAPYFWEVARADRRLFERTVPDNVSFWIARAHCYAVDISNCNPNVMMELGQIYWSYSKRPLLLLEREGLKSSIVDLGATLRIEYPHGAQHTVREIAQSLRAKISAFVELFELRNERHYLSPYVMRSVKGIDPSATAALAQRYTTIEEFLEQDPSEVARSLHDHLPHAQLVKILQESVKEKLHRALSESDRLRRQR